MVAPGTEGPTAQPPIDLRGERQRSLSVPSAGQHREGRRAANFAQSFTALGTLALTGARVSASVIDLRTGHPIVVIDDRVSLPIAGIGRILLLIEVSARMTESDAAGLQILEKSAAADESQSLPRTRTGAGSAGLWQHLVAPALPVRDLALLVAATDDALAFNALLRHVGLDAVRERAESLGLLNTSLLDFARQVRGPDAAPHLSVGSTAELTSLLALLWRGAVVDTQTSARVLEWLSHNADLSLVASAFALDPLAHRSKTAPLQLVNATGTDDGVLSEFGILSGSRTEVAYSASVHHDELGPDLLPARLRAIGALRSIGFDLLDYVAAAR